MRKLITLVNFITLACIFTPGIFAQEVATFQSGELVIPEIQVGASVYKNVYLQMDDNGFFRVSMTDEPVEERIETASVFDQQTNILTIKILSVNTNTYKNVRLRAGAGLVFEYMDAVPLFNDQRSLVSTPSALYPSEVADSLSLQMVAATDVNRDGLKDIVAHFWHSNWSAPDNYFGPVENALVVYIQDANRNFYVGNKEIFGSENIDLGGGASRKQVVADFNGDGYEDIAYAMNREDGRSWTNSDPDAEDNWASRTAVLLSKGNGLYEINLLEPEGYWHTVDKARNAEGGYDIVLSSLESCNESAASTAFRYIDGQLQEVTSYPNFQGATVSFLSDNSENGISDSVISFRQACTELRHFRLHKKEGPEWKLKSMYNFFSSGEKIVTEVKGKVGEEDIYKINDTELLGFSSWESCQMKMRPDSASIAIAQLAGEQLPADFDKATEIFRYDGVTSQPFLAFDVSSDTLSLSPQVIPNQDAHKHSYRFDCSDKTGDGYQDLISYNNDGTLTLYKNNKADVLVKMDTKIFPQSMRFPINQSTRAFYEDLNGDNVLDLIYYSNTPQGWTGSGWGFLDANFEVHWGASPIFDATE